ncbi:hypothetical protein NQ318_019993 [Aromia moschata]|uniref:Uncharacterized protein n=1 Tax=Aromia moschata TaxID=1265417 RepID=A0AAV8Y7X3_9CUCU|nr:hypothetical protein NQ318_019993 [Aromia moschata]
MYERMLTVKYLTINNSFIYLPSSFKYLKPGSCVQLSYGDNETAYFSVTVLTVKLDDNSVGINSLYAKALGIKENELVTLSEISQLPTVNSITISPLNSNDYDVLELLAENIQSTLLDQIRVVNRGQKFVIWVGINISIVVYVESIKPVSPGVVITHHSFKETERELVANVEKHESVFNMEKLKSLTNSFSCHAEANTSLKNYLSFKKDLIYRLVPVESLPFFVKLKKHHKLFNVFACRKSFPNYCSKNNTLTTPVICSLTLLTNDLFSEKNVFVRLYVFEDVIDGFDINLEDNLFVDNLILDVFECKLGSRVFMKHVQDIISINEINIHTRKNYLFNVEEKFKSYLADNSEDSFLLNSGIVINIGENIKCSLTFSPAEAKFCVVDINVLRNCKYFVHEEIVTPKEHIIKPFNCDKFVRTVSNYQDIINAVVANFSVNENHWENVLICGKPGTGKSSLLKIIKETLKTYPNYIYTKTIYCKTVKGKTVDSLFKLLSTVYSHLVLYQPSVLILDDLCVLCESITGDENSPNAVYSDRISEMLHNFFKTHHKFQ